MGKNTQHKSQEAKNSITEQQPWESYRWKQDLVFCPSRCEGFDSRSKAWEEPRSNWWAKPRAISQQPNICVLQARRCCAWWGGGSIFFTHLPTQHPAPQNSLQVLGLSLGKRGKCVLFFSVMIKQDCTRRNPTQMPLFHPAFAPPAEEMCLPWELNQWVLQKKHSWGPVQDHRFNSSTNTGMEQTCIFKNKKQKLYQAKHLPARTRCSMLAGNKPQKTNSGHPA